MELIDFEKEEMVVRSSSWPSLDDKQLHAHRLLVAHSLTHDICGLEQGTRRQVRRGVPSRSLTGLWRPGTTRQAGLAAEGYMGMGTTPAHARLLHGCDCVGRNHQGQGAQVPPLPGRPSPSPPSIGKFAHTCVF